jgi:hypothetical protein
MAIASTALLLPRLVWAARGTPIRLRDYLSAFLRPVAVSAVFGLGSFLGSGLVPSQDPAFALVPSLLVGAAAASLGGWFWPGARNELRDVWQHLPFGRSQAAPAPAGKT